uniref:Uncharacterized protein n=1 Tax=Anguilla anguilla TaxID=7936 RepID=A0A0E9QG93_ANGAN
MPASVKINEAGHESVSSSWRAHY